MLYTWDAETNRDATGCVKHRRDVELVQGLDLEVIMAMSTKIMAVWSQRGKCPPRLQEEVAEICQFVRLLQPKIWPLVQEAREQSTKCCAALGLYPLT